MPIVNVNKGFRDTALPRLTNEGKDVFPGSTMAVVGLLVEVLRARFAPSVSDPLPWVWAEDLTPGVGLDESTLPENPHKIQIESAYNTEKSVRDYYPSIYTGRQGNVVPVPTGTGDYVGEHPQTQFRAYHCYASMPLLCTCVAENAGESSTLGEIVWSYFLATRQILRQEFGFQTFSHPILGDTIPRKADKEIWETRVSFELSFDMRWGTVPHKPIIRDIAVRLRGIDNAEGHLVTLALRNERSV